MKNKQNEANGYECVKCETGETDRHGLQCSKNKKIYTEQEFKIDLEWFNSLGVSCEDAKNYIIFLLNSTPSHKLKLN